MIRSAKLAKELVVIAENRPGVLSSVSKLLADHGINIIAISAQAAGGVGLINLVVDEHLRASDLFRKNKFSYRENPVILLSVEERPGILRKVTALLASKKVNVLNLYGSTADTYDRCTLVLSTDHNQKAMVILKKAL